MPRPRRAAQPAQDPAVAGQQAAQRAGAGRRGQQQPGRRDGQRDAGPRRSPAGRRPGAGPTAGWPRRPPPGRAAATAHPDMISAAGGRPAAPAARPAAARPDPDRRQAGTAGAEQQQRPWRAGPRLARPGCWTPASSSRVEGARAAGTSTAASRTSGDRHDGRGCAAARGTGRAERHRGGHRGEQGDRPQQRDERGADAPAPGRWPRPPGGPAGAARLNIRPASRPMTGMSTNADGACPAARPRWRRTRPAAGRRWRRPRPGPATDGVTRRSAQAARSCRRAARSRAAARPRRARPCRAAPSPAARRCPGRAELCWVTRCPTGWKPCR